MLGLAYTLVAEGLHDPDFIGRYCTGYNRFHAYLIGETDGIAKDADWAAEISGLDADTIRSLARRMAATRTMISMSWSVQRSDHGEQPCWMAITLAAMLGQIGLPGGGVGIGYGSIGTTGAPTSKMPGIGLAKGANEVKDYVPVARVVDMLLNPGAEFEFNGNTLTYPISGWSTGRAVTRFTSSRTSTGSSPRGRSLKPSSCTSPGGRPRHGAPISSCR